MWAGFYCTESQAGIEGNEARMESIGDQTLYEDEYYVVLQNDTLVMPERRMALEFAIKDLG